MDRIINSMLDDDQYKFKTSYAFFRRHPKTVVKYRFFNRNLNMPFGYLMEDVEKQIKYLSELRMRSEELDCMEEKRIYNSDYLKWLKDFRYSPNQVKIWRDGDHLGVEPMGLSYESTLWEVKLMGIISELYSMHNSNFDEAKEIGQRNLDEDVRLINLHKLPVAEFGTRRRYSREWQEHVVKTLAENCPTFTGTSNIQLAMKYNLKAVGTMPHEWIMCYLTFYSYRNAQITALLEWKKIFPNDTVALTDTFGTDNFFKDFSPYLAKKFGIQRPDSGDPFEEGNKIIANYQQWNLDPKTAHGLFSDGLNVTKCIELQDYFQNKMKSDYAIGTAFTNNLGLKAPNMVIKAVECDGEAVVKGSNVPGKNTGDPEVLKEVYAAYKH